MREALLVWVRRQGWPPGLVAQLEAARRGAEPRGGVSQLLAAPERIAVQT